MVNRFEPNIFIMILILLMSTSLNSNQQILSESDGEELKDNINDITVIDMENHQVKLSSFNRKVLLLVNVASECGYTPQYKGLEEIYKKYRAEGFEILAFPCNDFGGQEPGTKEQILQFCLTNFGVTFTLFDKVNILGEEKSPLYVRLTNNAVTEKSDIKWNFEKFLISKDGKIVARYKSKVEPTSDEIKKAIETQLKN